MHEIIQYQTTASLEIKFRKFHSAMTIVHCPTQGSVCTRVASTILVRYGKTAVTTRVNVPTPSRDTTNVQTGL